MASLDEDKRQEAQQDLLKSGLLLVPGGVQGKKTITGLMDYARGYAETASGNKKYDIQQSPENFIKSALFGTYATPEGRQYVENIGISKGQQFYNSIKNLSPQEKAQKAAALRQKNPAVFGSYVQYMEDKRANLTAREKQIRNLNVGNGSRARAVISEMKRQSKPEDKARLFQRYIMLGIISDDVRTQVDKMIRAGALK
jgi:hypothetical protein